MVNGIIFDLDGTLLDTLPDIAFTLNETLKKFSIAPITYSQAKRYVGNGARKLVERAVPPEKMNEFDKIFADFSVGYAKCENNLTQYFDGVENFLTCAAEKGVKIAVITNKPQRALDNVLAKFLGGFKFVAAIGQSEKYALKPDPASTFDVLKIMGVEAKDCAFVGDGETDVLTAQNAKTTCVAALWGYRSKEQLLKAGAKNFASSYRQLQQILL